MKNKVVAIIVLYNQSICECKTLVSLNKSCESGNTILDIIVYDNSKIKSITMDWPFNFLNLVVCKHDDTNPGVSVAYNFAWKKAEELNYTYLLLLDQDTYFPDHFINNLFTSINTASEIELFAPLLKTNNIIYSPCHYYLNRGWHFKDILPGVRRLKNVNFLNSGLTVKTSLFQKVNGFNPAIKLYFSDFDFIDRCRKEITNFYCLAVTCNHDLGSADKSDMEKTMFRFIHYCQGARITSAKNLFSFQIFAMMLFLRAGKLAFHFREPVFFKIYKKDFLFFTTE